jgi:glycosyltransferase involved in cell wall biosynthesis
MAKVTICIPIYNSRNKLPKVLEELSKQEFKDYELLLCDDGSSDGTWDYLQGLREPNIKILRNEANINLPGTMKRLFDAAGGEFIAIHHDHEFVKPDWLSKMLEIFGRHPQVGMVIPAYDLIMQDGQIVERPLIEEDRVFCSTNPLPGQVFIDILAKRPYTPVSAHGTVLRASQVKAAGGYSDAWGLASDEDIYRRVASISDVAYCFDPVVTVVARSTERKLCLGSFIGIYTIYEFRKDTTRRYWKASWMARRWNLCRLSWLKAKALVTESLSAWSRGANEDLKLALAWDRVPPLPTGRPPLPLWGKVALWLWVGILRASLPLGALLGRQRRRIRGEKA